MKKPRGILTDEQIAGKVKEWYDDEDRGTEFNNEKVMDAIATAHAMVEERKPKAGRSADIYALHFTKFLRQELGLKP